jgi:hypothetical protein
VWGETGGLKAELEAQINDGDNAAAKIDQAFDMGWYARDGGDFWDADNFAHVEDANAEWLTSEVKEEVLAGARVVGVGEVRIRTARFCDKS